jgi:hypothetical protein
MSFLGKAFVGFGFTSCNDDDIVMNKCVATHSTRTSEAGVQVGVVGSKMDQRMQKRYQRMVTNLQRQQAMVEHRRDETSRMTSRLASDSEDYHIGKVISKLLKPEKKATSVGELHTCSVCLDDICTGDTNMTKTSCGHVFHLSCLLKSLTTKNKCPMCRSDLEDIRATQKVANLLTPVTAEQLIVEEISYFPNAAHTQSITISRHPKRRVKEMLRVFGFTLLRAVAQFVHDENMPDGWYDDSETTDSEDDDEETNQDDEENSQAGEDDVDVDDEDDENQNREEPDGYSSDNTADGADERRPAPPLQNQDLRFALNEIHIDEVHQAAFNAFR